MGGGFTVAKEMVTIKKTQKKISGRNFTPSVIEPSFGIGRIMYCMFEHTFYTREGDDEARTVFRFTPLVAPIKVAVFPLLRKDDLDERAGQLHKSLLDGRHQGGEAEHRPGLVVPLPRVECVLEHAVHDASDAEGGLDHARREVPPRDLLLGLLDGHHLLRDGEVAQLRRALRLQLLLQGLRLLPSEGLEGVRDG